MASNSVSRRSLVTAPLVGVALAQSPNNANTPITAAQVIERIKANVGVPWRQQTVDNIIAGSPDTHVRGIATTMMATFDVLKRALNENKNVVITHESTFFSHQDNIDQLKEDETYRTKLDFITKNGMVVFHFHDHWHARRPDGINAGMAQELGWGRNASSDNPRLYIFEATPLSAFAQRMEKQLGARTMRVLGDPALPVRRVYSSWGFVSQFPGTNLIARPDVDVLVCGETREWELVEYVQDMITSGKKKGLIVIGHVLSEQSGMKLCAEWLKGFITEVPISFVPAVEPFWAPQRPVA